LSAKRENRSGDSNIDDAGFALDSDEQSAEETPKATRVIKMLHPGPDHDFYHCCFVSPLVVYSGMCVFAISSGMFLAALTLRTVRPMDLLNPNDNNQFVFTLVPPVFILFGFYTMCILLSLVMEVPRPKKKKSRPLYFEVHLFWCLHDMSYHDFTGSDHSDDGLGFRRPVYCSVSCPCLSISAIYQTPREECGKSDGVAVVLGAVRTS
jgi:hypothetical protein